MKAFILFIGTPIFAVKPIPGPVAAGSRIKMSAAVESGVVPDESSTIGSTIVFVGLSWSRKLEAVDVEVGTAVTPNGGPTKDKRLVTAVKGDAVDVGAVEFAAVMAMGARTSAGKGAPEMVDAAAAEVGAAKEVTLTVAPTP